MSLAKTSETLSETQSSDTHVNNTEKPTLSNNPLYEGAILVGDGELIDLPTAERFRILRAKIERQNLGETEYRVLGVTSALPEEGKSVVSSNLARALSIDPIGKTLIIDCDLRKPSMHRFFRTQDSPGLSDIILEKISASDAIRQISPRLDLITAGAEVIDSTQVIEKPSLSELIEGLRSHYRYIIIDCPPTMLCPEPIAISAVTDAMLLVVRAWQTPKKVVKDAINAIGASRILGLVVNDGVDTSRQYLDYGYYGYRNRASKHMAG